MLSSPLPCVIFPLNQLRLLKTSNSLFLPTIIPIAKDLVVTGELYLLD